MNLRDVAKAAGVSIATASRVLNSPKSVSSETREKVVAKITELGFVRSAAARAINTGRSKILGALIPTIDSDIFAQTIDAIEGQLDEHGFSLVVATTGDNREVEARKAQEILDIGVEGLFLTGVTHNDHLHDLIRRTEIPTVAISYFDPEYHLPTFGYDNAAAAHAACLHLSKHGHRKIAVIHGSDRDNDRTRARIEGIKNAGKTLELSFFETELSVSGGGAAADALLASQREFDAVLCVTDVLAYGVIFALQRAGVSVPDTVSVMSIHDLPGSSQIVPRLSTIRLPAQEMGAVAARALVEWVEQGNRPNGELLPFHVIERESVSQNKP
ncbi:MAG: LacI family DNA-binding transcriptional regulator [Rhodobacteraceae bacterium]|nr:LacI family DNA-binding transcriptional regulator [Paracoccaceae bacterium]